LDELVSSVPLIFGAGHELIESFYIICMHTGQVIPNSRYFPGIGPDKFDDVRLITSAGGRQL
jgi:hypothetical protein